MGESPVRSQPQSGQRRQLDRFQLRQVTLLPQLREDGPRAPAPRRYARSGWFGVATVATWREMMVAHMRDGDGVVDVARIRDRQRSRQTPAIARVSDRC